MPATMTRAAKVAAAKAQARAAAEAVKAAEAAGDLEAAGAAFEALDLATRAVARAEAGL